MDIDHLIAQCGFEFTGTCSAAALRPRKAVRAMCANGTCKVYGHNWACPPHCEELDHFAAMFAEHDTCYVLQTFQELEDEFDGETMMEAERTHQARTLKLARLTADLPERLVLSAGTCLLCPQCTCPNEPCRHPDLRVSSIEAAGLVVSDVCTLAHIPYYHGPCTITYTGCLLL